MKTWTQLREMMEQIKTNQRRTKRNKTDLDRNRKISFKNKIQFLRKSGHKVSVKYEELEWPTKCPILHIALNYKRHNWTLDRRDRNGDFTSLNTIIVAKKSHTLLNSVTKDQVRLLLNWLDK